jgi:copper transport protein
METGTRSSAALGRGAIVIAAVVAALVAVPIAAGHAQLVGTTPANDAVLMRQPRSVVLRFNEPVESAFGSVRAYDSGARRVDDGRIERPNERSLSVGLERRLARGTYTVTWHVVSADSHPVSGAFVFHIQEPGANPGGIATQVLESGTPRSVTVLFAVSRALFFALLLLVVGGALALSYPLRAAAQDLRARLFTALAVWAAMLTVVALGSVVLQGAKAGGFGLGDAVRWDSVQAVLETRFGKVALAQAALGLAIGAIALAARPGKQPLELALLVVAAALVPTPSLAGHAGVRGGLALVSDIVHVASAAVWTGGLAFVVAALLAAGTQRWPLAAGAVPRFSKVAVVAVAALLVSGSVNGYEEVGAWRGLWDTTYGLLLLAKVALVLPVLALGAYNNRYAVPRLKRQLASPSEQRRFLRAAGAELMLVVAIVGVTAVLVTEPPARGSVAPRGPYATTVRLGGLEANVVVDPATVGLNVIHVYLTDRSGRPVDVDEVRLSASLPSKALGPLRFPAHPLAPGHYAVHGAQLALAGDWQLRIDARRGEFEALTAKVSIPIRRDS